MLRPTTTTTMSESLTSRVQVVLDIFGPGDELTDAEIVARHPEGLHRGKVIPARIRLERLGLVELVGKNAKGHKVWRRTPEDRIVSAREAAALRQKTPAERLAGRSVDTRVQVVAALLADESVNRALREQNERTRAWRRARARAQEAHAETEAMRRERKRALHQAERQKTIYLDFLKVHDGLRDAISVLLGIRSFMRDELRRQEQGEATHIPLGRWPEVGLNLRELIEAAGAIWDEMGEAFGGKVEHCPLCGERVAVDPHALDEGYIDVEAFEDEEASSLIGDEGSVASTPL